VRLNRPQIVEAATAVLQGQGLAGLSMRRVAQELEVQPGALYYHVANKQDLLAEVAARILAGGVSRTDPRAAATDLRAALLEVRDSAEVVSFVQAYRPEMLPRLDGLFRLPAPQAEWAARTLVRYVLGFVAEEQNRAELVRTGILPAPDPQTDAAFEFGLAAVVGGLGGLEVSAGV
jgi:AcrR family transcriptional regulator